MRSFTRHFIALLLLALGFPLHADEVIRIMAANTTSGNGQDYDPGHGNRIFQGLDPDIVLVQEFNYLTNSASDIRSWVDMNFGATFSYFRENGGGIPNGIVSRYPILASGEWNDTELTDRDFAWAKIDIPGDKNLWALSVHLKASSGSTNASRRNNQASQLLAFIDANIPDADYLVIGGDFNTYSRTEPCIDTLSAVFATGSPWPVDQSDNGNTNAGRDEPYDWVIPDAELNARKTTLVIGSNSFPDGLVFDSQDYTPLSEVSPVLSGDSATSGMQHMAVMRAFLIETNELPVIAQGTTISRTISQNNHPAAFAASLSATDADADALSWTISQAAAHGSAAVVAPAAGANVTLSYTPANDYLGNDTFTVQVSDGHGGTDTILVNVTVNAVAAYDAWTYDNFAPLTPSAQAAMWGEAANPDQDSHTNLEEFALGLNPAVKDTAPNPLGVSPGTSPPVLTYLMRMDGAVPALSYTLESKPDLTSGIWATVAAGSYTSLGDTAVSANFKRRAVQLNSTDGEPRMFYRLKMAR